MNTRKSFNLIMSLIFGFSLLGMPASVLAQEPNPVFYVEEGEISGWGWTNGESITFSVDNRATPNNPDYSGTATITNTQFRVKFWGLFDIKPGFEIIVSDGVYTKSTIMTNLQITMINPYTDTMSGTAEPGSTVVSVACELSGCGSGTEAPRTVITDPSGNWVADYSVLGDQGEPVFDIVPGTHSFSFETDDDGDGTEIWGSAPSPVFKLNILNDSTLLGVDAWNWPLGSQVTLTVDDPGTPQNPDYTDMAAMGPGEPNGYYHITHAEYAIDGVSRSGHPGITVTLSDGIQTKSMVVPLLVITGYDLANDTISGISDPFLSFLFPVEHPDGSEYLEPTVVADSEGNWLLDLGGTFDLRPGDAPGPQFYDDDRDLMILLDWSIPNPFLQAQPGDDRVVFEDWPLGASVTLQIEDPSTPESPDYTTTATVTGPAWDPTRSWFSLNFQGEYDLKPGDIVTGTDGMTTKQVTVTILTIENVDPTTESVTGTAEPGSRIEVFTDDAQVQRRVFADSAGEWSADFSVPGNESWEAELSDIGPGDHVMVFQEDEDRDRTVRNWYVPNINFSAFPSEDYINGHNWPWGAPLQIEIDDPATPVNPDYTGQATDWDPNVNSFRMIDFHGQYDMKPGDIVTVTNGTITKTHVVTEFSITEIDVNTDIVSGLAEPGSEIDSWICDQYSCAERWVTADQDGNWSANFSILDDSTVGYGTYDFTPGTGVEASQADEDGDKTVVAMDVPFDSDGDGIADDMDACPNENASGYDADENGCVDTAQGLSLLLQTMPADEVASNIKTPLLAQVNNAIKSLAKGNVNAAIHQLEAFIHQVEAQHGKTISQNAADLLIAYAQNVIAGIP